MNCKNCGNEIPEGARVCVNCGVAAQEEAVVTPAAESKNAPGKILSIVSLVLGVLSILSNCCCSFLLGMFAPIVAVPFSIAGLVTGFIGMKQAKDAGEKNGMAIAGLICSVVGVIVSILFVILMVLGIAGLGAMGAIGSYGY